MGQKFNPPATHFFGGCRKWGNVKIDKGSMQIHREVGRLTIGTPFFKIRQSSLRKTKFLNEMKIFSKRRLKKNKKPDPIHFHNTCFYQTGIYI